MFIGEAGVGEPMWIYLSFIQRAQREKYFVKNPVGLVDITGLVLTSPSPLDSDCAKAIVDAGVMTARTGPKPLLEMEFDRARRNRSMDFRPQLPLLFRF